MTCALLQTSCGKDELNIVFMWEIEINCNTRIENLHQDLKINHQIIRCCLTS